MIIKDGKVENAPKFGYADKNFDPENIALIGIKYGLNDRVYSNISKKIWIDDFGWKTKSGRVNFDFETITDPIESLKDSGYNIAAIVQTEYMDSKTSNTIKYNSSKTHTDNELKELAKYMHENDLRVVFKPHVDVSDDSWRGEINPKDKTKWFESYTNFIVHYAKMADECDAEMLVMGTEFKSMIGDENREQWENVVEKVRKVFFFKQKTAYEIYQCDWSSDVCSSDLFIFPPRYRTAPGSAMGKPERVHADCSTR